MTENELLTRFRSQVMDRDFALTKKMKHLTAWTVMPVLPTSGLGFGFGSLGSYMVVSLQRLWARGPKGNDILEVWLECRLIGKDDDGIPSWERGETEAYDLRLPPFNTARGKILNSRNGPLFETFLAMDKAIEEAHFGTRECDTFENPVIWAGFDKDLIPSVRQCQAADQLVLTSVSPGYTGPQPDYLLAKGGKVNDISVGDRSVAISWGSDDSGLINELPPSAVLRPSVYTSLRSASPESTIAHRAVIADALPRRHYNSVDEVADILNSVDAKLDGANPGNSRKSQMERYASELVEAHDVMCSGYRCRRLDLCRHAVSEARIFFEDVGPLMTFKVVGAPGESDSPIAGSIEKLRLLKPRAFDALARLAVFGIAIPALIARDVPPQLIEPKALEMLSRRLAIDGAAIKVVRIANRERQGLYGPKEESGEMGPSGQRNRRTRGERRSGADSVAEPVLPASEGVRGSGQVACEGNGDVAQDDGDAAERAVQPSDV